MIGPQFSRSEVRRYAALLPVAITGRLGPARTIDLLGGFFVLLGWLGGTFGTPRLGFSDRAFGGRRERRPVP